MSERSESILDHMAEHLRFLSSAQSFWFTLDTSYGHGCHVARRFCLKPHDYEVLLIVAGLALYSRYGFKMKPTVSCVGSVVAALSQQQRQRGRGTAKVGSAVVALAVRGQR
jgi:hypothetical protein